MKTLNEAKDYLSRQCLCDLPRQYLIENNVTYDNIGNLEKKLASVMQVRKRRTHFKDFIQMILQNNNSGNKNTYFSKNKTKISNIKSNLIKTSNENASSKVQANYDVGSLFEL